jgi:integrase
MAYAGLSQQETLPLKWRQLKNGGLEIGLAHVAPDSEAVKILRERFVPLLESLAEDLEEWRVVCGSPELGLIFPSLRKRDWQDWVCGQYHNAAKPAGRGRRRPWYLAHTFSSLLIGEGRSMDEVARQTGLSREEVVTQYAHLFEEARVQGPVSAPARIRDAREALGSRRGFGFPRMLERLRRSPSARDIHAMPRPRAHAAIQEDS